MPHDNQNLSIRWLIHSRYGPVVIDVKCREDRYVAELVFPQPDVADIPGVAIADSPAAAVDAIVAAIDAGVEGQRHRDSILPADS
jgi:hypothetical protein